MLVYTPGVWDLLHVGHINFLERAAAHGKLVVGVASDSVVKEDKGALPIIPQVHRIRMLNALSCVHLAIAYYTLDFIPNLITIMPDTIVLGGQWGCEERHKKLEQWAHYHSVPTIKIPYYQNESSTKIKERIYDRRRMPETNSNS